MNDEKRLSEDELAAIEERDKHPLHFIVTDVTDETYISIADELKAQQADRRALLQHTRALENELHIERAQPTKEHLRLYYELHSTLMQVYEWLTGERPELTRRKVTEMCSDALGLDIDASISASEVARGDWFGDKL